MSIFNTPAPSKATVGDGFKVGPLTGRKDPPPTTDRAISIRHVPNADVRKGDK